MWYGRGLTKRFLSLFVDCVAKLLYTLYEQQEEASTQMRAMTNADNDFLCLVTLTFDLLTSK